MSDDLIGVLEVQRAAQRRGKYNATDQEEIVSVEVSGDYSVRKIQLDGERLGITQEQQEQIEGAVKEAVSSAIQKGRQKAKKRLDEVLETRSVKE